MGIFSKIKTRSAAGASQQADPEYYDAKQLSRKLNVSVKTVSKWTQEHKLPVIKMGRMNRYPSNEINRRLLSGVLFPDIKSKENNCSRSNSKVSYKPCGLSCGSEGVAV